MTKRTTIYLEPELHRALKIKAAAIVRSSAVISRNATSRSRSFALNSSISSLRVSVRP